MKLALLAAATLAMASPAFAATTTFTDAAMTLSNYAFTTYAEAGFDTHISQVAGNGGGTAIEAGYIKTGATNPAPRFQGLSTNFVYDPSAQGAITSIDFSIDQLALLNYNGSPVQLNAVLPLRLLAEQDGKVYEAFRNSSILPAPGSFVNTGLAGLTAADFFFFDPANPHAARTLQGLDFAGSAIRFGFEATPFGVTVGGGPSTGATTSALQLDNFSVTVTSLDVAGVPEPAAWATMIVGFGLAGRRFAAADLSSPSYL